jgi:hypothetical protein
MGDVGKIAQGTPQTVMARHYECVALGQPLSHPMVRKGGRVSDTSVHIVSEYVHRRQTVLGGKFGDQTSVSAVISPPEPT